MAGISFDHKGPNVVLTEGKNDCHVILALCQAHDIPESFGFFECGSDEKAIRKMSALVSGSEKPERIGIVLDADNPNLAGKWQSLKDKLSKAGYSVPGNPDPKGTIVEAEDKPKIGIWLMPNNQLDGKLEDFCAELANQDALNYARECVATAKERSFTTFKSEHKSKADIHTYLAWQDEPGNPLGLAITATALDAKHPLAKDLANFLEKLFDGAELISK